MAKSFPNDPDRSFTVNGIYYANREEYERRLGEELTSFAEFLYDVYQDDLLKDKKVAQSMLSDSH